jgi:hypothetical protein
MSYTICMWRGSSFSIIATGHFSSASGSTVWLVKLAVRVTRSQALVHPSRSWSIRMRISSGTAQRGRGRWVLGGV